MKCYMAVGIQSCIEKKSLDDNPAQIQFILTMKFGFFS
jgi:hypothetical protein